ncbi:hypothetical protein PYW07_010458 [Mythimna separata]|uniref:F-box domain-containing protein n=1 Tax=Mythimna separata TaxID=271217 RepID=A0AAD7YA58_MYTSE|nr:hypothetical protein PYW07_010458 [Mythimna separata]
MLQLLHLIKQRKLYAPFRGQRRLTFLVVHAKKKINPEPDRKKKYTMSESDWSSLPLLPLTCILNHLSTEDAVKAMSTCRHWRNAALLYEGRRDTLKLHIKQLEKCQFLVRLFKKNVRRLHLYIDCNEPEIDKFMNSVFPQLFDIPRLQELLFIGPSYIQQSTHVPSIKLRRVMIESLIFKNSHSLTKLGFFGCSLGIPKNENDRYSHQVVERYSRPLKFDLYAAPENSILTRANQRMMMAMTITHIISDVDHINTRTLETLATLMHLRYLTINVTNRKLPEPYHTVDWVGLEDYYRKPLKIAVNIPVLMVKIVRLGEAPPFPCVMVWSEEEWQADVSFCEGGGHTSEGTVFLAINVTNRKLPEPYHTVDWVGLEDYYRKPLKIAVNIIGVPYRRFNDIMEKVLVEGMTLVSLKVMFCKSLYTPLISHVARLFPDSLREVMWVDSPYDSTDPYHRVVRPARHTQSDAYAHVNPFVLMCWQCTHLQRLVIHGYWVWQYDVLGFVRLRKDLRHLEVSAIYYKQDRFQNMINLSEEGAIRVLCGDSPTPVDADHIRVSNYYKQDRFQNMINLSEEGAIRVLCGDSPTPVDADHIRVSNYYKQDRFQNMINLSEEGAIRVLCGDSPTPVDADHIRVSNYYKQDRFQNMINLSEEGAIRVLCGDSPTPVDADHIRVSNYYKQDRFQNMINLSEEGAIRVLCGDSPTPVDADHIRVSNFYKQDRFQNMINLSEEGAIRVLCGDSPTPVDADHIREVNEFIEYPWTPTRWCDLHPALRGRASNALRTDFVVKESRTICGLVPSKARLSNPSNNDW